MKWTARALTCSALLALAATAMLGRLLQQQGDGAVAASTTRTRAALGVTGAQLAQPAAVQGQAMTQALSRDAGTAAPPVAAPASVGISTASPPAPPLHYIYVGHWTDRGRTQVVLQRDGFNFTVQGPGRLDDDYQVLAVSTQQLSLLHRASGTRRWLVFDAPGSEGATGGKPAGVSGMASTGFPRAVPLAAVPPAHAPANSRGDTEDQQETN